MFDFINEFGEVKNNISGYRYQNYGGEIIIVQGYKDILFFDENSVILKLKTGELQVRGDNLKVNQFSPNSIVIKGKIVIVERVE